MKKIFLLSLIIFLPSLTRAAGLVPCDGPNCNINSFFQMLAGIYNFIVWQIATPLAIIAVSVGGIMMMISAGNANLFGTGKKVLFSAIIGLALVFCSVVIINFVLNAVGAKPI